MPSHERRPEGRVDPSSPDADGFDALVRWRWLALAAALTVVGAAGSLAPSALTSAPTAAPEAPAEGRADSGGLEAEGCRADSNLLVLHVDHEPTPVPIALLRDTRDALAAVHGVDKVWSALDVTDFALVDGRLTPVPAAAAGAWGAGQSPLSTGRFVSPDGRQALLWLQLAGCDADAAGRDRVIDAVVATADRRLADVPHHFAGLDLFRAAIARSTVSEFTVIAAWSGLLLAVALWVLMGSRRVALGVLLILGGAVTVALGTMGAAGHRLGLLAAKLPVIVFAFGVADVAHLPIAHARIRRAHPDAEPGRAVARTLRSVWIPCTVTTLTSAAGVAALWVSPLSTVAQLGCFAAVGVVSALALSMVVMAVALRGDAPTLHAGWLRASRWVLERCTAAAHLHPRLVAAGLLGRSAPSPSYRSRSTPTCATTCPATIPPDETRTPSRPASARTGQWS